MLDLTFVGEVNLTVKEDVVAILHFDCNVAVCNKFLEFPAKHLSVCSRHVNPSWSQLLLHQEIIIVGFSDLLDILSNPWDLAYRIDWLLQVA